VLENQSYLIEVLENQNGKDYQGKDFQDSRIGIFLQWVSIPKILIIPIGYFWSKMFYFW